MRALRILILLFALTPALSWPTADTISELKEGLWLEVRGQYRGDQNFVAEKITLGQPEDEASITGTIIRQSNGQLVLLKHELEFEDDATFKGISQNALPGSRVKVQGELSTPWTFSVEKVKARDRGRARIEGPIDKVIRHSGSTAVQVLGYLISLSDDTEYIGFGKGSHSTLSKHQAPRLYPSQLSKIEPDEDDRFGSGFRLSDSLRLTSRIVSESAWENNFDFDDADNENRQDLGIGIRSRLEWNPASAWAGVFELRYSARHRERQDRRKEDTSDLEIGEAYITSQVSDNTWVTLGRQDFDDPREWLYDANLDAVAVRSAIGGIDVAASVSKIFSDDGSREQDAVNYILTASQPVNGGSLSAYFIHRNFAQQYDENSHHYGLRAYGNWFDSKQIWIELVRQGGNRLGNRISAFAIDVGGTFRFGASDKWYANAGLAFASGDDPNTSTDETFRQTGLQDNNGKLGGVASFRYYGELSDPELSNLWIATAGVGTRVSPQLSLDLIAHRYRLDEKASEPSDVEWDSDITGASHDLGWETDLVVGYQGFEHWEAEAVFGYFSPGEAFISGKSAWFGKLQLKFRH